MTYTLLSKTINKQTGGVTLMMALVLVVAMGLMSVYSAQVTVTEQKISSNLYRTKQGFEAAQAGLDAVLNQLNVALIKNAITNIPSGNDTDSFTIPEITLPTLSYGGITGSTKTIGTYSVKYQKNITIIPLIPGMIDITVSGFSGDNQSTSPNQKITQSILPVSLITYIPPTPLISRKKIRIGNNVSITNNTNSSTGELPKATWSGGTTNTNFGGGPATIDVIAQDGTDGGTGVYEKDADLAGLTSDEFFQNFFSESKQRIKNKAKVIDCSSDCSENVLIDNNGSPVAQIIWIDSGNSGKLKINGAFTLGTPSSPVLLIVDGKIEIDDNNANINGIIYTTKDFNNNAGAGNINGSFISEGNITASGNFNLTYDEDKLVTLEENTSHYIRVAGSWKDF